MSKKRDKEDEFTPAGAMPWEEDLPVSSPVVETKMETKKDTVNTGLVSVENLMATALNITLTDGTNLVAGPKGGANRSKAVPKKLFPAHVRRLEAQGKIRFVVGG